MQPSEKLQKMLAGERVICSDEDLNELEKTHEVRSLPNPKQIGTKDCWVCWIGAPDKSLTFPHLSAKD